jgi:hypothetical protein
MYNMYNKKKKHIPSRRQSCKQLFMMYILFGIFSAWRYVGFFVIYTAHICYTYCSYMSYIRLIYVIHTAHICYTYCSYMLYILLIYAIHTAHSWHQIENEDLKGIVEWEVFSPLNMWRARRPERNSRMSISFHIADSLLLTWNEDVPKRIRMRELFNPITIYVLHAWAVCV